MPLSFAMFELLALLSRILEILAVESLLLLVCALFAIFDFELFYDPVLFRKWSILRIRKRWRMRGARSGAE